MWLIVRTARGPGSLPAGIHTDGSDPQGGGVGVPHQVPHLVPHPPHRLTAPAVKKGGSLPSSPSPLARLVSSGLGRKTRTGTAKNGRVVCHTPPSLIATPPPVSAWHFDCPAPCPAPCPGTARKMRSALARQLGSGEPETRPNMETVNRAVRGRFGGCAFGKLPQCFEPFRRCAEST